MGKDNKPNPLINDDMFAPPIFIYLYMYPVIQFVFHLGSQVRSWLYAHVTNLSGNKQVNWKHAIIRNK